MSTLKDVLVRKIYEELKSDGCVCVIYQTQMRLDEVRIAIEKVGTKRAKGVLGRFHRSANGLVHVDHSGRVKPLDALSFDRIYKKVRGRYDDLKPKLKATGDIVEAGNKPKTLSGGQFESKRSKH